MSEFLSEVLGSYLLKKENDRQGADGKAEADLQDAGYECTS
jgi:hypothetical protein